MKSRTSLVAFLGLLVAVAAIALPAVFAPRASGSAAPGAFNVDPVHSAMVFRIRYSGVSSFWGRFNGLSGTVNVDPEKPETVSIDLTVKTESVDTGNERRDGHLKSADFFSAKQHPEIRFQSKSVKKTGDNAFDVTGDLTLRGVTKSVTAKATWGGKTAGRDGGVRVGFDATLTIARKDFEITFGEGQLGNDVDIHLGLTATGR